MIDLSKINCTGCHSCYSACPQNCIKMQPNDEGFLYPRVNIEKCIDCGRCETVCPSLEPASVSSNSNLYACYRKDFNKRLESASGGVFSVFAEYVIANQGMVYGAAFDDKYELKHIGVDNLKDLFKLKGSKYVQSLIGQSFKDISALLENGNTVLFSGTPCQVQGLKKYLGKEYDNLICLDLICHGVPSPKVWNKYITEISYGRKITYFNQRDKSNGIYNAPIVFEFSDGKRFNQKYDNNLYIRGFIQNLYLRSSCYKCDCKGIERTSDITIGDFWGLENIKPDFVDEYGVSAVIIHSRKGQDLFEKISNSLNILDCEKNYEWVMRENPCINYSVPDNPNRQAFFNHVDNVSFDKLVKENTVAPSKKNYYYRIKDSIIKPFWIIKQKLKNKI